MGTTAEKGQRVLQSIAEVQEGINNLGGNLTDQTPFKDFKTELDNIYKNIPKTEFQEGTSVTIENGLKGKIDFDSGKVGFGQASQESTTGINLLNYITNLKTNFQGLTSVINDDGSITTTGIPAYDYVGIIDINITSMLEIGQSYTISQKTASPYLYLQINATNTQTSQSTFYFLVNDKSRTFTAEANTTYILRLQTGTKAIWGTDSRTLTNFYQLEKGSSATSFEKYTGGYASPSPNWEQEIKYVRGKNLFNGEFRQGNQDRTDVSLRIFSKENNWKLEVGKTYTISTNIDTSVFKYALYIAQYPYLSVSPLNTYLYQSGYKTSSSFTFTCNYDGYFGFTVAKNSETDITPNDMENVWFQVEENSQATPYLPYNTIQETIRGINYCNLSNSNPESTTNINISINDNSSLLFDSNGETVQDSKNIFDSFTLPKVATLPKGDYTFAIQFIGDCNVSVNTIASYLKASASVNSGTYATCTNVGTITNGTIYATRFTLTEEKDVYLQVFTNSQNKKFTNTQMRFMIYSGSYPTTTDIPTYEPYVTPRTYQFSLGDHKFYGIGNYRDTIRRSSGKNLFDEKTKLPASRVINGITYTNNGDGTFNISGTATSSFFILNISVASLLEKGKKYGLYSSKAYSNSNFNYTITYQGSPARYVLANEEPFEFDEQKTGANLALWVDSGVTVNATNVRTMIYESDTKDSEYEPHGVGVWYKYGVIGETIYTGANSENWLYWQGIIFIDNNNIKPIGTGSNYRFMLNYFASKVGETYIGDTTMQRLHIILSNVGLDNITNVNEWKTWLSTHNLDFIYICNETYTPITGTLAEQLEEWWNGQSLDGTTIIEGNGDLPMIIKVRGLKGE